MTRRHSPLRTRLLLESALAILVAGALAATMHPGATAAAQAPTAAPDSTAGTRGPTSTPYRYAWPVKPFRAQHPVRGFFGDPRVGDQGRSRQFHFGIDVSAPNGTPVYATLTGSVRIHPLHATAVLIEGQGGVRFEYWHVVPTVRTGQRTVAYRTMIGRVEAPNAHVHFSEARGGRYVNPLRPGAMGPFVDTTTPVVRSVVVERSGGAVVAEAYDETPLAVPRPWQDLPVAPALVRWRVVGAGGRTILDWQPVVDFRETIPPASSFDAVWAPGTTQNHVRAPGRYRLLLSHALPRLGRGTYVLEVEVRDTRLNTSTRRVLLGVADE